MHKIRYMKRIILSVLILSSAILFAQERDSIKSNNIEEVVVNGKYYKKYVEKEGSSSLRLDEELIKIPQNVSIITNRALEDQQVTTLSDGVLRNVAGAQRLEHWGDMYTRVNMRGSRAAAFLNGVNVTSNWGPLSEDMSFVDHIEFIKGPSGFLMSNGEPSGIYNIVTKKPTGKKLNGTARVTLGSYNMYRGETDIDTKLTDKVAFRLNLMAQNKNSFRDYEFNNRYIINPSLKVMLSDRTTLTAEYIYQKAKMSEVGSAYVFSYDGYATRPQSYTHTDPGIAPTNVNNNTVNVNLQHQFNDNWKLTTQLTYVNEYTMGSNIWPSMFVGNYMIRRLGYWEADNTMKFGQAFLNGLIKTGNVNHKILAGLDLGSKKYLADWSQRYNLDKFNANGDYREPTATDAGNTIPDYSYWYNLNTQNYDSNGNIAYYGPNNSTAFVAFDGTKPLSARSSKIDQNYTGFYIQDELGFFDDKLRLTLAARYTSVTENNYGTKSEADKITPRVGISYSIDQNLAVYGLFDQAFVPQAAIFRNGDLAKPITGNNFELGVKKDWFGGKWNTTLAAYNIIKNNATVSDPNNSAGEQFSILLGKTRVQGIEFDLKGEITRGFNAIFNYAFTENKVTESNEPISNPVGMKVPGYAKHTANGWLNYTFINGVLEGFGLSFGGTYLADRSTWSWANNGTQKNMGDYVKFDAGLSWENTSFRVGLNVFNVFNRYLYSGAAYGAYYYYQAEAPRNFRLSVGYKF